MCINTWKRYKEKGSSLFTLVYSGTSWQETMSTNWNTGGSVWTLGSVFYFRGGWALAQAAQRGCGVSVFRDNQKLSGHSSGQLALGVPAWAEGLDKMTFRATFQPQLFCSSAIRPFIRDVSNLDSSLPLWFQVRKLDVPDENKLLSRQDFEVHYFRASYKVLYML